MGDNTPIFGNPPKVTFRQLVTAEEYLECAEIQRETWGSGFGDIVPPSVLKITQKVGGVTAGAFDSVDKMLGFVYGITGIKDGKPVHWSHMLAVRKVARKLGLGKQLKFYQRELLLKMNVKVVLWTFDPLVARNAHLNLNALGAVITEYVENMYIDSSSDLHRGLGMDRFIAAWHLDDTRVQQAEKAEAYVDHSRFTASPVVNTKRLQGGDSIPVDLDFSSANTLRVQVPSDIETIQVKNLDHASQWRGNTRRVFQHYLSSGYTIAGFYFDQVTTEAFYCLERK